LSRDFHLGALESRSPKKPGKHKSTSLVNDRRSAKNEIYKQDT
jgi:hypothetical protein